MCERHIYSQFQFDLHMNHSYYYYNRYSLESVVSIFMFKVNNNYKIKTHLMRVDLSSQQLQPYFLKAMTTM